MSQPSVHQLFRRLETVGKGAYGSVHKGVHIPTGNLVALKIINLDTADDDVADIQREVTLLTQLRDAPNVTKYYGCYLDGPRVWIAMEFAQGGSVRTLMKASKGGVLEEKYIVLIVREVLLGLNYLHKSAIIHRDIKAANILITAVGKVMICDFGVSALSTTTSSKRNTLMGTPNWMAPEVAQPVPNYDSKADIWSLGIMIYEMVKGTPPHADLGDPLKVMSLITRVKPPRLLEGEGSRDEREFVSFCLKELPNDRLTAEELGKTKWIRSVAKEKVSVLRDLILRYDAWMQNGGSRASLADPLDWEQEEHNDMQPQRAMGEENPWEFDTVRGRSASESLSADHDLFLDPESDNSFPSPSTVRPRAPGRLPTSLRGLFDDDSASEPELFRPPAMPVNGFPGTPSPSPPSPSSRDRAARKRGLLPECSVDDLQTAKQANFAFPPRSSNTRNKSKLSASVSGSEDEDFTSVFKEHLPPLGLGLPSSLASPTSSSDLPDRPRSNNGYRERSTSRGLPNIEIPPPLTPDPNLNIASASSPLNTPFSTLNESSQLTPISKTAMSRKRSQSSVTGSSSRNAREWSLDSPSDFQFPPPSGNGMTLPTVFPLRTHSKASPNHASVSSLSPSAHQTTYSLDASVTCLPTRRMPPVGPLPLPPSIHRAHSANATPESLQTESNSQLGNSHFSRKPSLSRQASVAVMENVPPASPLVPPVKPFARPPRDRSGSGGSQTSDGAQNMGLPGLKDVLKIPTLTSDYQLGMSDLLPPSPSAVNYSSRVFAPPPSALSSSVTVNEGPGLKSLTNVSTSSLGLPRTHSPPSDSSYPQSNGVSSSAISNSAIASALGPAMRPLDFSALMRSHEGTHVELARTVEDLSQWLSVVEVGLSGMLDITSEDLTITEEHEDLKGTDLQMENFRANPALATET